MWICVGPRDPATKPSRGCLRVVELSAIPKQLPTRTFGVQKVVKSTEEVAEKLTGFLPRPNPRVPLFAADGSSLVYAKVWLCACSVHDGHGRGWAINTPGTRMEICTWRSAIADLKGSPPGAPSGALGEGTPGWVWRCGAAISRYHTKICLFVRFLPFFSRAAKTPKWRHFR